MLEVIAVRSGLAGSRAPEQVFFLSSFFLCNKSNFILPFDVLEISVLHGDAYLSVFVESSRIDCRERKSAGKFSSQGVKMTIFEIYE